MRILVPEAPHEARSLQRLSLTSGAPGFADSELRRGAFGPARWASWDRDLPRRARGQICGSD
eukprot:12277508-Alexandrium_andersonii.AAC.1